MYYQLFILFLSLGLCLLAFALNRKLKWQKKYKITLSLIMLPFFIFIFRSDFFEITFYKVFNKREANELIINRAMGDLVYNPQVEKYVDGKDSAQVYKEFKELFKLGRRRFSYEELKKWKLIMLELFNLSDKICAEVFIGDLERAQFYNYIMQLDSSYVEMWIELMSKAIIYEVTLEEYFAPEEAKFNKGLEKVLSSIKNSEEREKYKSTYRMLKLASDKDICRVGKMLYKRSDVLSESLEEEYLKFLVAIND